MPRAVKTSCKSLWKGKNQKKLDGVAVQPPCGQSWKIVPPFAQEWPCILRGWKSTTFQSTDFGICTSNAFDYPSDPGILTPLLSAFSVLTWKVGAMLSSLLKILLWLCLTFKHLNRFTKPYMTWTLLPSPVLLSWLFLKLYSSTNWAACSPTKRLACYFLCLECSSLIAGHLLQESTSSLKFHFLCSLAKTNLDAP